MSDTEIESIPPLALHDDRSYGARFLPPKHNWMTELRERIDAEAAIDQLNACVAGRIDLTAQQVRSAEVLLRKKLPDLSAVAVADGEGSAKMILERIERVIVDGGGT